MCKKERRLTAFNESNDNQLIQSRDQIKRVVVLMNARGLYIFLYFASFLFDLNHFATSFFKD